MLSLRIIVLLTVASLAAATFGKAKDHNKRHLFDFNYGSFGKHPGSSGGFGGFGGFGGGGGSGGGGSASVASVGVGHSSSHKYPEFHSQIYGGAIESSGTLNAPYSQHQQQDISDIHGINGISSINGINGINGHYGSHLYAIPYPFPVPVPQPIPYSVPRPIPVSVPHPIPVTIAKPYPVPVPVPYPQAVPFSITKTVFPLSQPSFPVFLHQRYVSQTSPYLHSKPSAITEASSTSSTASSTLGYGSFNGYYGAQGFNQGVGNSSPADCLHEVPGHGSSQSQGESGSGTSAEYHSLSNYGQAAALSYGYGTSATKYEKQL